MRICVCLTGMIYGITGRHPSQKDVRHCWPNIKKNLINPFESVGFNVEILLSTYKINDVEIEKEIMNLIKPKHLIYSNENGSNPLTCKLAPLDYMYEKQFDFNIMTRSDIHYNKPFSLNDIKLDKFNFLFPEKNAWDDKRYCSDNLYFWPIQFTQYLKQAITEAKTKSNTTHTHDIYKELCNTIGAENLNFISNTQEFSDVNSFYSLCRPQLDKLELLNEEVKERFYK